VPEAATDAANSTVDCATRVLRGKWLAHLTGANGPNHGKIGLATALINGVGLFSYDECW